MMPIEKQFCQENVQKMSFIFCKNKVFLDVVTPFPYGILYQFVANVLLVLLVQILAQLDKN